MAERVPSRLAIRILQTGCAMTVATGLVAASAAHPVSAGPWLFLFDLLRWPLDGGQGPLSDEARISAAVIGGVMAGWGVMLFALVSGPMASGERDAQRMYVLGLAVWFVVDTTASLLAGWPGNALLDCGFLLALLRPLLLPWHTWTAEPGL